MSGVSDINKTTIDDEELETIKKCQLHTSEADNDSYECHENSAVSGVSDLNKTTADNEQELEIILKSPSYTSEADVSYDGHEIFSTNKKNDNITKKNVNFTKRQMLISELYKTNSEKKLSESKIDAATQPISREFPAKVVKDLGDHAISTGVPIKVIEETQDVDISSLDIGHALKDIKFRRVSDVVLRQVLTNRWEPIQQSDFPFSECKRSGGKIGRRYLNRKHLEEFKWLAVSKYDDEPNIKGVWCVFCAFFKTNDCGGGTLAHVNRGGGQKMGKLVNAPLLDFSNLTGSKGCLTTHENTNFHKMCLQRVDNFLMTAAQGTVHGQVNKEYKMQCLKN